ncbi:hypothetical protein M3650_06015 [Paenibacillus sp. MER TA 81-3]|nr:hypothetical protein [Paenibacillus sp. MER TA 81-3]
MIRWSRCISIGTATSPGSAATRRKRSIFQKNMDIVPTVDWPGMEQTAPTPNTQIFTINQFNEKKEAAFQWIMASVSLEYQQTLARAGTPSVITGDKSINAQFAADNKRYEGKNIATYFQCQFAPPPARESVWDSYVKLYDKLPEFAKSDMNKAQ